MRTLICLISCIFFIQNWAFTQTGISYQAGLSYGYIMNGTITKESSLLGFNIDINKKTNGKNYWQSDHKFPQIGVKITALDLNNYDGLKYSISAIPYLEFNLLNLDIGKLQLKHGTGLAYVAGRFDPSTDLVLGSRFNATSIIDLGFSFDKGSNSDIKSGILISHISNGNLASPNSGLNSLSIYIQYNFFPNQKGQDLIKHEKNTFYNKWGLDGRFSAGLSNYIKDQNSVNISFQDLSMITYQHNTRFRTGAGIELIIPENDKVKFGIYAEETVCIAHLVTHYGLGYVVSGEPNKKNRLYEKVGIAWFPFKLQNEIGCGLYLGADIKAHKFKAAHIDISIGYLFNKIGKKE